MIDNDYHPIDKGLEATNDHWGTQLASNDVPTIPIAPSIVPEQSPNLNILKSIKDQPPATKSPGTNFQSHPYWKNR